MRIGIDFDNTIVNYDGVFYQTGRNLGWLPAMDEHSKAAVKTHFFDRNEVHRWTELQGIVYGRDIKNAIPYPSLEDVLKHWYELDYELFIVSHKTRYPIIGDKLDFHQAATAWLNQSGLIKYFSDVFYCQDKHLKIAKINELQLAFFIDDLPSILSASEFPMDTKGILFSPDKVNSDSLVTVSHWSEILNMTNQHNAG